MTAYWTLILAAAVAGCATRPAPVWAPVPSASATAAEVVREPKPTRLVETRYEIRGYREADDPSVRHEGHAVYRTTRVPVRVEVLETVPRSKFDPVTYTPLPPSDELAAVISTQKEVACELGEIQTRMALMERKAQTQYRALTSETADVVKLRRQLESERARVRSLELELRERAGSAVQVEPATPGASEMKW